MPQLKVGGHGMGRRPAGAPKDLKVVIRKSADTRKRVWELPDAMPSVSTPSLRTNRMDPNTHYLNT